MPRLAICNSDPRIRALAGTLVPMVKRLAYRMKRRLPPHVDADDLVGLGLLGLAQAAAHWDAGDPNAFVSYALQRAKGAMLDDLRKSDQLTRAERRLASRLFETEGRLANRLGRRPEIDEIASASGITADQVEDSRTRAFRSGRVSLSATESSAPAAGGAGPERALEQAQRARTLSHALDGLPDRLRSIVDLSCAEDLTLRQIGVRLGVTEARVCQLRKQAVDQLRRDCADTASAA